MNADVNENTVWISVLLCTYNDELYIREAVQSILDQTYPHFEFVIIDDGSTDGTNKILKEFLDPRIRLIEKSNTGLIDSLNFGFSLCKYNWVARMDGDDIALPNRLNEQIKHLGKNISAIGTQAFLINSRGKVIGSTSLELENNRILYKTTMGKTAIIHPTALINRGKFLESGGYDKFIFAAEDLDLWLRLSNYGLLKNLNSKELNYRLHEKKISNLKRKEQFLNSHIALIKYKKKLNWLLSESEYVDLKDLIEKNIFYQIGLYCSIRNINKKNFFSRVRNLIIQYCYFFTVKTIK